MKQQKNLLIFLIILLLVMTGLWLSGAWDKVLEEPKSESLIEFHSVEPAEITEPLKTWHLGALAFDVPESLSNFGSIGGVVFYLDGSLAGARLEFHAGKAPEYDDNDLTTAPMPNERLDMLSFNGRETDKLGQEDVSEVLGRPAGLNIYFDREAPSELSIYFDREASSNQQVRHSVRFSAAVRQGEAILRFAASEPLEQHTAPEVSDDFVQRRKEIFLGWVAEITRAYHWTGRNQAPADGQLITAHGYLDLSGIQSPLLVDFAAYFNFSGELGEMLGVEMRYGWNLPANWPVPGFSPSGAFYQIYSEPKDTKMTMTRIKERRVDSAAYRSIPVSVMLNVHPLKEDKSLQSYIMGVYQVVLKSARPTGEAD